MPENAPPLPLVIKLPAVMLPVVVMLAVEFNTLTTLPLKLNPTVFTLPLVMLPVTDKPLNVPTLVILFWPAVINVPAILVPLRLPPVIFPTALNPTFDVNVFAELLYRNVTNGLP